MKEVTLLSVGTKLLPRVVAARAQEWADGYISDHQNGFRRNRGSMTHYK